MTSAWGTFDYVATVPDHDGSGSFECLAQVREPVVSTGDERHDFRLVGLAPLLRVADGGMTPDASTRRPWVMRSTISLIASTRRQSSAAAVSFHVDKALIERLQPGDVIHLARTPVIGLGLSVIRGGELVVAAGAVTAVPLGPDVEARIPMDLVARAQTIFRQRDPDFEFRELPVEVSVDGYGSMFYCGRQTMGQYIVFVDHGFLCGLPGRDACAAISRIGACNDVVAYCSALLLGAEHALEETRWPDKGPAV